EVLARESESCRQLMTVRTSRHVSFVLQGEVHTMQQKCDSRSSHRSPQAREFDRAHGGGDQRRFAVEISDDLKAILTTLRRRWSLSESTIYCCRLGRRCNSWFRPLSSSCKSLRSQVSKCRSFSCRPFH